MGEFDRNLTRELADLYPDHGSIRRILREADVPQPGLIEYSSRPINTWHAILRHLDDEGGDRLSLLQVIGEDFPGNRIVIAAGREASEGEHVTDRSTWVDIPEQHLEKLMARHSTLMPIKFLHDGLRRSRAVARIVLSDTLSTGFLVGTDLLVTNNHVIPTVRDAEVAIAEFGYDDANERDQVCCVRLAPRDCFVTSVSDDLTLVQTESGTSARWGQIPIDDSPHKRPDRVNIIQHPEGGSKQIALYHNIVSYADDRIVQYYTDTLPGSSGSPVFNSTWELVAIHHSGGDLYEPGSGTFVYRNEGVAVERLIQMLSGLA